MELWIGFALGIVASVIASFVFLWLTASSQRPFLVALRTPRLRVRLLRQTPEREIADVIRRLFRSWGEKDSNSYLACWSEDCIRLQGSMSDAGQSKAEIAAKFKSSCERYASISVRALAIEDIHVAPDGSKAVAHVSYRFELVRSRDALPIVEESREVYSLRRSDGVWQITANIDHFATIGPSQG